MPEGDSVRRAAERLSVLAGEVVSVETPHPRAAALGLTSRLDGLRLERVDAVGKNLLLTFEGDVVLRSHLRMRGRWHVGRAGAQRSGRPWLVLRGREHEAVLWNGPVLELGRAAVEGLGPDILSDPLDLTGIVARMRARANGREVGDALLDQRLVAGIGNMWRAEALYLARVSPWERVGALDDETLATVFTEAAQAMRAPRGRRLVYRRAGLPCRRCGALIQAGRQGDAARTAYWCPACQVSSDGDDRSP
jgi:endonuclease VIII